MIHALKIRDEKGFTTAGMAVSLLVSIALMFSGAQLYRVHSASAEIQEVADAASLAAENEKYLSVGQQTIFALCSPH